MDYPFESIRFNGRDVRIADILNGSVPPQSPFESSSFLFIKQWYGGDEFFAQPTSGSTGAPKTISIARTSMVASAKLTQQALQLKTEDSALLCLDPNYIAGKMMIVRAFETGMKLIAVEPSLNPFEKLSHQQPVDFTALIPAQLSAVLHSKTQNRLHEIRNIIIGGAPLNEKAIKMVSGFRSRIYATYGMTETVSHIALQPVNGPEASEYFKVLPGIRIGTTESGCLTINVPFLDEEIATNDIVEIKSANEFKWLGRSDNVINSGGVKIIPEIVESQIANVFIDIDLMNRFVISSIPDPVFGDQLVLLVEGNLPISGERLRSALQQALPRYHIPKQIVVNAKLVMAENGKINRDETRKKNWDSTRENG
jgi:o-succinylbenzoate---CoA ligase